MRLRSYSKGMIQRVGVAQALVARPDVVFFDEPMSGLDPLGRRDLRQLMIRLRDRGCTVFFSSHILSDAEALCTRVGIVAQGRLVAEGRLAEMVAFELRGWELVVTGLSQDVRALIEPHVKAITALPDDRHLLELAADDTVEDAIGDLVQHGVRLISVNPVRTTLEDYFVATVRGATARDTSSLR
jgi:ABC-2 type transport system ATP-binding protein